ncbi:MAG: GTPase domain-containing protein [Syntrophobacterales bacterium]|nr:GTPase domain-containing protein [Syntrophobacterales bacterium]
MAFIDLAKKEIQVKIVYYGPARSGKTTNLQYLYRTMSKNVAGKMVTIDTKGDRTLFFDFLPLNIGKIKNLSVRIQLYTVPGQVIYNATRKLVLKGTDGIVFVADSLRVQRQKNVESFRNLEENLQEYGLNIDEIPLVLQYNKRDLIKSNFPLLSVQELEEDLNARFHAPAFEASAVVGFGVFETLKEITKITIRSVARKLL